MIARLARLFSWLAVVGRSVAQAVLVIAAVFHAATGEYDAASACLLFVITLELTDPHRPGRVIVLRSKR